MRFGRILLALLAPLVSLPALAADGTQDHLRKPPTQTPGVDSLMDLLRSVVPAAVSAGDSASHLTARAAHSATVTPSAFRLVAAASFSVTLSPAAEAALRRLLRQQHRSLLRC